MTVKTLATKCGGYQVKDEMAELSNSGQAWKNSTGSFHGEAGPATQTGSLPAEFHDSARRADYVIYSYETPIAWKVNGAWVKPDVRYSLTTSNHQGALYRLSTQTLTPAVKRPMVRSRYGSRAKGY